MKYLLIYDTLQLYFIKDIAKLIFNFTYYLTEIKINPNIYNPVGRMWIILNDQILKNYFSLFSIDTSLSPNEICIEINPYEIKDLFI